MFIMLKMNKLVEGVDEKYIPMLKMVNIVDFTKCIAQFSGLKLSSIKDEVIKDYLLTWAKNKYRFFEMLGNQIRIDTNFSYNRLRDDIRTEIVNINKEFPVYAYWLDEFADQKSNKIDSMYDFNWGFRNRLTEYFPNYKLVGSTITHFFKGCLKAPDELITKIAAIFENNKIEATHTISIDPVDMMLASENPYDWQSCYRLEVPNESSHADGCLASVLDTKSLITYVWNREGKLKIYDTYEFKSVRYKRMRQWIAISNNMTSIHFNAIYPGKNYEDAFEKQMRDIVETIVAKYKNIENIWRRDNSGDAYRKYGYGYSEFDQDNIWVCKDSEIEDIEVFDVVIKCPCGCGLELPGSHADGCEDENEEIEYSGNGFICESFDHRYWCDYMDDYCEEGCDYCCEENCCDCCYWRDAHPVCDLDHDTPCEDNHRVWIEDGVAESCKEHCSECPLWAKHHPEEAAAAEGKKSDPEQLKLEVSAEDLADTTKWIKVSPVGNAAYNPIEVKLNEQTGLAYVEEPSLIINGPAVNELYTTCIQGMFNASN